MDFRLNLLIPLSLRRRIGRTESTRPATMCVPGYYSRLLLVCPRLLLRLLLFVSPVISLLPQAEAMECSVREVVGVD